MGDPGRAGRVLEPDPGLAGPLAARPQVLASAGPGPQGPEGSHHPGLATSDMIRSMDTEPQGRSAHAPNITMSGRSASVLNFDPVRPPY